MVQSSILNNLNDLLDKNEDDFNINFPCNTSFVNVKKHSISDDIILIKDKISFSQNTSISCLSKEEGLCINIVLNGRAKYKDCISDETVNKIKATTSIKYINSSHSLLEGKKDNKLEEIGVIIKGTFLKKLFLNEVNNIDLLQKNYEKNITTVLKKAQTNTKTAILANEIYNSPFRGNLNSVFLQGKVYEIIYNEFTDILQKDTKPKQEIKLSKEDIEALHKAKNLICEDKKFLSISDLSKEVALNEFKLKYGFKKFFNTSPGNMILEYRMYEAKNLLEISELNITEISKLVGYKYVQSFTNAFRKKFNVNPKDVMKTRKYYY